MRDRLELKTNLIEKIIKLISIVEETLDMKNELLSCKMYSHANSTDERQWIMDSPTQLIFRNGVIRQKALYGPRCVTIIIKKNFDAKKIFDDGNDSDESE